MMTKEELIQLRMNMLGGMNEYVKCFDNEDAYYDHWICLVPDECTEEDLEDIAENDEFFNEVVECFAELVKEYGNDLYIK